MEFWRMSDETDDQAYVVLVNEEEQYSLWPAHKAVPAGWSAVDCSGDKETCMAYVDAHWTDMRPKSLRVQMDGA